MRLVAPAPVPNPMTVLYAPLLLHAGGSTLVLLGLFVALPAPARVRFAPWLLGEAVALAVLVGSLLAAKAWWFRLGARLAARRDARRRGP